jgi:hypothetical protein
VLIYDRLKKQNRLADLTASAPVKDFSTQTHPGKYVNESQTKPELEVKNAK